MATNVALLAEGVDRNNDELIDDKHHTRESPSSRRAWIEIARTAQTDTRSASRPPRGGRG